ncbi:hypothetical protein [Desertibacillus haloalkaliphilus]|uniref:hypothetical protein n=1 Tax=Desertibacillus haloalkaliphilus TaxID=1328930 RepID=UPI001C280144|nr:hypothetical protein [Desertibacillus haloalkaliphilus]MBU8908481.1 hypothetical protein [Desertibacillus haloalkaliphilus]
MNYTIDKLNEADFFLNKLKEHKNIFPEFDYFLNAFVSSARAVLWIMNSEYDSNNNWRNWYENKSTSESEDILLRGITNMRNRSLKQAPLKTKKYSIIHSDSETVDVYSEMKIFLEKNGKDKKYNLEIKEVDNIENQIVRNEKELTIHGILNIYDTVEEFKDSNVIDKCEEYFLWLKSLVEECTSLFNNQDN